MAVGLARFGTPGPRTKDGPGTKDGPRTKHKGPRTN